jgi:hypothetical protein
MLATPQFGSAFRESKNVSSKNLGRRLGSLPSSYFDLKKSGRGGP